MIDVDDPIVARHIQHKARLAREHARARASPSSLSSSSTTTTPRGNRVVSKWIKLDLARPLPREHDPWALADAFTIECIAGARVAMSLGDLRRANGGEWSTFANQSWHCVTGWSCRGLEFRGVDLDVLFRCAFGKEFNAKEYACVYQIASDGYTVGVDARDVEGAFLAVEDGVGAMLSREHGGPRLIFPRLFGWKSAKYLRSIAFLERYEDGFWEKLGCHRRGRWSANERWSANAAGIWTRLAWITDLYARIGGERLWIWVMVKGGAFLGFIAAMFTSSFGAAQSTSNARVRR